MARGCWTIGRFQIVLWLRCPAVWFWRPAADSSMRLVYRWMLDLGVFEIRKWA